MDEVWLESPAAEKAPLLPQWWRIHLYNEGLVGAFLRASKASVAVDDHDRDLGLSFNRLLSGLVMKL